MKNNKLNTLLNSIGKENYIELFENNNILYDDLQKLSIDDLQEIGIEKLGDRIHIFSAIEQNVLSKPKRIIRFSQRHSSFLTLVFSVVGIVIAISSIYFAIGSLQISKNTLKEMQQQRDFAYQPDVIPEETIWKVIYSRKGIGRWHLHYVSQSVSELDSIQSYIEDFDDKEKNSPHKIPIRNVGLFSSKPIDIALYPVADLDSIRHIIRQSNVDINVNHFLNPTLEMEFHQFDLTKVLVDSAKYLYTKSFQFLSADPQHNVVYIDAPKELHKFIMAIAMIKANKTDMPDWALNISDMFQLSPLINIKIEYKNFFGKKYKRYFEITFALIFHTGPAGISTDAPLELDRDRLFYFGSRVSEIDSVTFWNKFKRGI